MGDSAARTLRIALVGNPNGGKTALFNRLTGSRQKVANYAGVTVARKEGRFITPAGRPVKVLDLPGAYSLLAVSPDEAITRDCCRGVLPGETAPDVMVCVADATNLQLHLYFILELRSLGRPMIVALNMMDVASRRGIHINTEILSRDLGVPVVGTVAVRRGGVDRLVSALEGNMPPSRPIEQRRSVTAVHGEVRRLLNAAVLIPRNTTKFDDALDGVLLHPLLGPVILVVAMFLMFQAVFAWAAPLMEMVKLAVSGGGDWLGSLLPEGPLRSLLVHGVVAGAGAVLVFIPQILILFLFILVLEESGYLPRAAVLLDRFMVGAGLSGRSFIPLLSSFACAVPGIMATRTIQDPRDRFATIMVAPLMTCSARLPVYALLIAAFIPQRNVMGVLNSQGLVLFALYAGGVLSAIALAYVLKLLQRDRSEHALLLELPSYRWPKPRDIAIGLWERSRIFLSRVGTIILPLMVLLWFVSSYPVPPLGSPGPTIEYSMAGWLGHHLQPLFAPLGFNWQICVALVPGLAAREVAVSSLATVYSLSASTDAAAAQLSPMIASSWPLATALSLLVFYVFAPMCVSTLAVIRRETDSSKAMLASAGVLFGLAYVASFAAYRIALALS